MEHNVDIYHTFINFKFAYDSVPGSRLYEVMYEFNIVDKLRNNVCKV